MKTNKLSWVWIVMVLFIFACEDIKRGKMIVGNWGGAEWLVDGKPSTQDPKTTSFTFTDKGDYTYQNGGNVEKGTFKVSEGKLFTTPTGEQEMAVEIEKLTNDSLVFDMNRGGQLEVLTLIRKK